MARWARPRTSAPPPGAGRAAASALSAPPSSIHDVTASDAETGEHLHNPGFSRVLRDELRAPTHRLLGEGPRYSGGWHDGQPGAGAA
eukprot:1988130-Prymnesium_polylepis.1